MMGAKGAVDVTNWNAVYSRKSHVYGRVGNGLLWQYLQQAPDGPVLDLGCGEGRNGILAARLGRRVLGIDISPVAVGRANRWAEEEDLPFEAQLGHMRSFEYPTATYAAVVACLVLHFLRKAEVVPLLERFRQATVPGGILFASGLRSDDRDALAHLGRFAEVEPGCFYRPDPAEHHSFFDPGELRRMLEAAGWEVLEYLEGAFLAEGEAPQYHREVMAVARNGTG